MGTGVEQDVSPVGDCCIMVTELMWMDDGPQTADPTPMPLFGLAGTLIPCC